MKLRMRVREHGFTLIEVVVSIALFALVMGIVYSGFTTAVRAYDAAESRVDEIERVRVVSAFIRRSVGGAHALAIAVRRQWQLQFEGDSRRLRYVADLPGYVGVGGLHELVIELEPGDGQSDLVMRRRPLLIGRSGELQGELETRVLAEDIDGFAVRFYGSLDGKDEPAWRDDWSSAKHTPLLVELTITPANGPPWPLLQVRVRVDAVRYVKRSNVESDEDPATPEAEAAPEEDGGNAAGAAAGSNSDSQNPSRDESTVQ